MEMWCSDDKGRDSRDWLGRPGVDAPRLLKRSLSRLYYCVLLCCVLCVVVGVVVVVVVVVSDKG